jgi:transketolase
MMDHTCWPMLQVIPPPHLISYCLAQAPRWLSAWQLSNSFQFAAFARVVSMPRWELLDDQPVEYRAAVFGSVGVPRLAVEAGVCEGWFHYTGRRGEVPGIQCFGASAPGREVLGCYGFTVENVVARAPGLLSSPSKGVTE